MSPRHAGSPGRLCRQTQLTDLGLMLPLKSIADSYTMFILPSITLEPLPDADYAHKRVE
jgi:hypothetical protein